MHKILIRCIDKVFVVNRRRTYQEICMRTLNSLCPANIEKRGSRLINFCGNRCILKAAESFPQCLELVSIRNPRQKLLPDWTDHGNLKIIN